MLVSPAKHSPAPWGLGGHEMSDSGYDLQDYLDRDIAFFMASFIHENAAMELADRQLIVAAPDLFHAARLAAVQLHEIWRNNKLPMEVQLSAGWAFNELCQAISAANGVEIAARDSVFSMIDYLAAKGGAK